MTSELNSTKSIMIVKIIFSVLLVACLKTGVEGHYFYANDTQFPFQVSIFAEAYGLFNFCSGALIEPRWVLTAANCFGNINNAKIQLSIGATFWSDRNKSDLINTTEFYKHPLYDVNKQIHDIALIKLPKPVQYDQYMQPIDPYKETDFNDTQGTAVGWRMTQYSWTKILLYDTYNIISNQECKDFFANTTTAIEINDNMFCVSTNNNENAVCDNGGAFIRYNENNDPKFKQLGIGSDNVLLDGYTWKNMPLRYTRVAPYINWIFKTMCKYDD